MKGSKNNFRLHFFYSDVQGRLVVEYIMSQVEDDLKLKDIFICAPPSMINSLKDQHNIYSE